MVYKMQPSDQMSAFSEYFMCWMVSGQENGMVPTIESIMLLEDLFCRAKPKSVSFTRCGGLHSMMFLGVRFLCTTRFSSCR